jgi:hypothetical protein
LLFVRPSTRDDIDAIMHAALSARAPALAPRASTTKRAARSVTVAASARPE